MPDFGKLRGRQTDLDPAFEEWAEFRGLLRRCYGYKRATQDGGWLKYAEQVFATSADSGAPRPTAVRLAALEQEEDFHPILSAVTEPNGLGERWIARRLTVDP